ncbi:MAG: hypothetical protein KDI51_02045 [Xanthomonadales bacterium]|nr:hypothetical protein [Xanthomonadales bacterium]MCB1633338.1 hypothetical protein [Xanthomonadales bacterium]
MPLPYPHHAQTRGPRTARHHTDLIGFVGRGALALSVGLALTITAHAEVPLQEQQRLSPWTTGDGTAGDGFGIALAQDGDWLAVGAWGKVVAVPDVLNGLAQGETYLYRRVGGAWEATQDLSLPDLAENANFGAALALRGDRLLVAAPRLFVDGQEEAGRVYLYEHDGNGQWLLSARIDSLLPQFDGRFGTAVAWLDDEHFAVGAPREVDRGQGGAGRVHVYVESAGDWVLQQTLLPATADAEARFGAALAEVGGGLLVGSPQAGPDNRGAVDRFIAGTLQLQPRVATPVGAGAGFGSALATDGTLVAVGAPLSEVAAEPGAGQVVLYPAGLDAGPGQTLQSPIPADQARYGAALTIADGRLWVGEPQADVGLDPDDGKVHVYPLSMGAAGVPLSLSAPAPGPSGRLGTALAVEADGSLLAGADLDKVGPNGQGSVQRFQAQGGGFDPPVRIDRGDGAYLERFGSAVAISGSWAVASSFLERTEAGSEAGAVYLYQLVDGQWQRFQRLLSPDPAIEQRFGVSVALDGERLAVGAYWDALGGQADAGAAYVFRFDGSQWLLERSFRMQTAEAEAFFGFSVALDGDRLLVGAPGANVSDFDEGAGFVYRRSNDVWTLEDTLLVPGEEFGVQYGTRVALRGDLALLAAPGATSDALPGAGAVARFRLGVGWAFEDRLQAAVPQEGGAFGSSLALGEGLIAIGASTDSTADTAAGAIHLRSAGGDVVLTAHDAMPGDRLGSAIALSGDVLLAGAPGVDIDEQSSQGALYRWRRIGGIWTQDERLLVSDGSGLDGLGLALAADGEWAMLAAPFKAIEQPQEGYVYAVTVAPLFADGFED